MPRGREGQGPHLPPLPEALEIARAVRDARWRAARASTRIFTGAMWPAKHIAAPSFWRRRSRDCGGRIESTRPLVGAGKRSISMRVASLEVLTAATLLAAIVVVLWEMKIFHGM